LRMGKWCLRSCLAIVATTLKKTHLRVPRRVKAVGRKVRKERREGRDVRAKEREEMLRIGIRKKAGTLPGVRSRSSREKISTAAVITLNSSSLMPPGRREETYPRQMPTHIEAREAKAARAKEKEKALICTQLDP